MSKIHLLICCLAATYCLSAQTTFKPAVSPPSETTSIDVDDLDFRLRRPVPLASPSALHRRPRLDLSRVRPVSLPGPRGLTVQKDATTGEVILLDGRPDQLPDGKASERDARAYLRAVADLLGVADPDNELHFAEAVTDQLGQRHIRLQQRYRGLEVYPADARLHASGTRGFDLFTGRLRPSPVDLEVAPTISRAAARTQVQRMFSEQWIDLSPNQLEWISGPQLSLELLVYAPHGTAPSLAWHAHVRPNLKEHRSLFIDAHSGAILHTSTHTCGLSHHLYPGGTAVSAANATPPAVAPEALPDGPATAVAQDLYDRNVTLNTFSLRDTFYLLDGSRDMFTTNNGRISGYVLTYDGGGSTPLRNDFNPGLRFSVTNTGWDKTSASVHDNAGKAYQYFLDKFGRNSIDGAGGNVLSFMNINETDGTEMDNAFWNGRALFYGNGADVFQRLPRGLDVAGHEMAHGVIQSTANLIYEEQSGALNESFADVFGYLIEGESGDYRIGEDVVTGFFPNGRLRDLQDPNNGVSPGQRGWQPGHMDEFRNLPNTEEGDRGGVHINSGIPNRAFYLFSSNPNVGDARAEQVYYRALTSYLTRSSQFADLRIAVVRAAGDLFGEAAVTAANQAFDGVGIGGQGGDYTVDLETNEGDRFLLLANTDQSALFLADENGTLLNNPLVSVGIASRPSVTDDGEIAVFVDTEGRLRAYYFTTGELEFIEGDPGTNWRNIAISKDGRRVAVTDNSLDNRVLIFDFDASRGQFFTLYNPTFTQGINSGDVAYADALAWDPAGEVLMYDALSQLDDGLEFWDINLLRAYDLDQQNFGDGLVVKLINDLPEDVSIGNPTFSKNSPYIIAFEEVDFANESYKIVGANVETGRSNTIFENVTISYPNYGLEDDRLVFDAQLNDGTEVLAVIPLAEDKISAGGSANGLITDGHWGYFFANGERNLNTGLEGKVVTDDRVRVFPTVTEDLVTVATGEVRLPANIQVLDLAGRQVARSTNPAGEQTLSLGHLAAGSYFLAIPTEAGTVVRRVIKR